MRTGMQALDQVPQQQAVHEAESKEDGQRLEELGSALAGLQRQLEESQEENTRLSSSKMSLLRQFSSQMETMRDSVEHMRQQLQAKEQAIRQLVRLGRRSKEGYVADADEQKSETRLHTGLLTFGRSKFSTPKHVLHDAKRAKIDLARSTCEEIERLRAIIKVLSSQGTIRPGSP